MTKSLFHNHSCCCYPIADNKSIGDGDPIDCRVELTSDSTGSVHFSTFSTSDDILYDDPVSGDLSIHLDEDLNLLTISSKQHKYALFHESKSTFKKLFSMLEKHSKKRAPVQSSPKPTRRVKATPTLPTPTQFPVKWTPLKKLPQPEVEVSLPNPPPLVEDPLPPIPRKTPSPEPELPVSEHQSPLIAVRPLARPLVDELTIQQFKNTLVELLDDNEFLIQFYDLYQKSLRDL
ncbi:hypothetical protein GEMRC1_003103 [Eukaryota sp. GEM-RC1]